MTDATEIKTKRHEARMRRDGLMEAIEKKAAQRAVTDVREKMKAVIYDAQAKALEELRESLE